MQKRPTAYGCPTLRRVLVKHGTLNLATGKTATTHEEWRTGPCDVPLFSGATACKGCASGWTHPENFPVTAEEAGRYAVRDLPPMPTDVGRCYGEWQATGNAQWGAEEVGDWLDACGVTPPTGCDPDDFWTGVWSEMETRWAFCPTCEGSGIRRTFADGGRTEEESDCPTCNGYGVTS